MSTQPANPAPDIQLAALADDLRLLCRLHGSEADAELLDGLQARPLGDWFALRGDFTSGPGAALITESLAGWAHAGSDHGEILDALAVDYADIYLTGARHLAPSESYWFTEEHIERQEPMFEVRRWYAHYGLKARDWRRRPDDHLVTQLEFVAALLEGSRAVRVSDAGRFLDRHLLRWAGDFLAGVERVAGERFYQGVARVTNGYLDALRDFIEVSSGEPRRSEPHQTERSTADGGADNYVPGTGPGW